MFPGMGPRLTIGREVILEGFFKHSEIKKRTRDAREELHFLAIMSILAIVFLSTVTWISASFFGFGCVMGDIPFSFG
jgi:hypothetical protein